MSDWPFVALAVIGATVLSYAGLRLKWHCARHACGVRWVLRWFRQE